MFYCSSGTRAVGRTGHATLWVLLSHDAVASSHHIYIQIHVCSTQKCQSRQPKKGWLCVSASRHLSAGVSVVSRVNS